MTHPKIVPCIWLHDQAEQAVECWLRVFPGGRVTATSRYPQLGDNPSGRPPGSVLTVEFQLAGQRLTALNGGPVFKLNPSISLFVHVDSHAEADRVFNALADGGQALMPPGAYPWSERYGWVMDCFGVSWQVMAGHRTPGGPVISPCLMFNGAVHGRAEQALGLYAGIFGGRIVLADRYQPGEDAPGTLKHGRAALAGHELAAMDSSFEHGFTFNEALSLQVMCDDQSEVDRCWNALGEGGEFGPCGWLKDRFGVSWQVVPSKVAEWMSGGAAASDRVFAAIMSMSKLDIAALERAFAGR